MACVGGQTPVSCSLCEEDTKIKWKCLNCDMLMCDKCKEKIHVKFKFARDHKVVSLQEVGLHAEEKDFSTLSCKKHSRQSCVMFCKTCDCLVCPLCISEIHNGHGLVAIREGYEIQINKLKTGQKEITINVDELKKRKAEVEDVDRSEYSNFENTMKKIKDQNILLKNKVDKETEKLETDLIKKWKDLHLCTKNEGNVVSMLIETLESKQSEFDDIMQSNQVERVFVDGLGLVSSVKEKVTTSCTKFDSIPSFLPGQIASYNIGSLQKVSTMNEIEIDKQFDTEISRIDFMAAFCEDVLWITNNKTLQKVKIEGTRLKLIDKKNIEIYGMACTPSRDLLLINKGSTLEQISGQTGKMTKSVYEVKGFALSAVHVSLDGKVIVGAFSGEVTYPALGRRVVVVMDKRGKHETTYEYDRLGKSIFTYIYDITRAKNGNICVVDKLSKDNRGRVVILSEDGDVLNTFSGSPEVNVPFQPISVYTTQSDNIIVTNLSQSIIYFLNNFGNHISWCDASKKGIIYPYSFCCTGFGHSYIGCVTLTDRNENAKLYEVNIPW